MRITHGRTKTTHSDGVDKPQRVLVIHDDGQQKPIVKFASSKPELLISQWISAGQDRYQTDVR